MTQAPSASHSAVVRIAQSLRTKALALQLGEYIGSEESLSRDLQVSGPTLRQAIRLLEHEELVRVKRGMHGGYSAARPNIETISRVAAVYLRGNLTSIHEIIVFLEYVQPLMIDLVLASGRVEELRPYATPDDGRKSYSEYIQIQTRFTDLLWELTGNAPLQLIYAVFYQVGSGVELKPIKTPTEGFLALQRMRTDLAAALLASDRAAAIEISLSLCRIVHEGLKQNVKAFDQHLST